MDGHKDGVGKCGMPGSTSHLIESDSLAEDGLGGCDTKADDDARLDNLCLGFQPRPTRRNLRGRRFFVFAALTLRFPFEMLHRVGDIQVSPGEAGFFESLVQNLPRRSYERVTGKIFLISGLFADQHDGRLMGSFSKDRLSGVFVEITPGTAGGRFP